MNNVERHKVTSLELLKSTCRAKHQREQTRRRRATLPKWLVSEGWPKPKARKSQEHPYWALAVQSLTCAGSGRPAGRCWSSPWGEGIVFPLPQGKPLVIPMGLLGSELGKLLAQIQGAGSDPTSPVMGVRIQANGQLHTPPHPPHPWLAHSTPPLPPVSAIPPPDSTPNCPLPSPSPQAHQTQLAAGQTSSAVSLGCHNALQQPSFLFFSTDMLSSMFARALGQPKRHMPALSGRSGGAVLSLQG